VAFGVGRLMTSTKLAFTFEEAGDASGYGATTIKVAVKSNKLVARYANRKPVILASELQRWLESLPEEPPKK